MTAVTQDPVTAIPEWLEERQGRFITMADQIWDHPELALAEYFACGLQADDLAADGFTITRNVGDLPTAFVAEWSQGEGGPIIVHGSSKLAQSLAAAGLVDRYHLLVFPVVLGDGNRLWANQDQAKTRLRLAEHATYSNGVQLQVWDVVD